MHAQPGVGGSWGSRGSPREYANRIEPRRNREGLLESKQEHDAGTPGTPGIETCSARKAARLLASLLSF